VRITPGDIIWAATLELYSRRVYFLGDSFTAGSSADNQFGYEYFLGDTFGWEVLNGGESGTAYLNGGSGGGRSNFLNRIADVPVADPDMVVIYAGTNDQTWPAIDIQNQAAAVYAALATSLPGVPLHDFGPRYPKGGIDTLRDTATAAVATAAAAAAAPNVKTFTDVETWFTGTGASGTNRTLTDAAVASGFTALNSAAAAFTSTDVGRRISGPSIPVGAFIQVVGSSTGANMNVNATVSGSPITVVISNQKGDGNAEIYTSSDNLHPTTIGHRYIAGRMANVLLPEVI
jgi:lysophospholipase L1-like esterase